MLEIYSKNQTLATGVAIPLANVSIIKGTTAIPASVATINLNKCGVYMISCDVAVTGTAATEASVQMTKDGVLQPQAETSFTLAAATPVSGSFVTLIQVSENNTSCCCSSPTAIQFIYTGDAATGDINVCVTKIC